MKLNMDCIRDILLEVEKSTDCGKLYRYSATGEHTLQIAKYDHAELLYHFRQCNAMRLFAQFTGDDMGRMVLISDLSPEGHAFLENIRQESTWEKSERCFCLRWCRSTLNCGTDCSKRRWRCTETEIGHYLM